MRGVLFDAHAAAAAVALLAAPEFVVQKRLVDGNARGQAADEGYERFAVAFAGCAETKHVLPIIVSLPPPPYFAQIPQHKGLSVGPSF